MPILNSTNHPINCGLAASIFSRTFEKRKISDRKFDVLATQQRRILSSASSSSISIDKNGDTIGTPLKNIIRNISASSVSDYVISVQYRSTNYFQNINITSEFPNILSSPDLNNVCAYQNSGFCRLLCISEDGETSIILLNTDLIPSSTVDIFTSWANGSLAKHCTDQINSLINNKTQLNVFNIPGLQPGSAWNINPTSFPRNSDCWVNGIDLSCASPWNSDTGSLKAGTLISKKHVIFCNHGFHPPDGTIMTFVSPSNNICTRTLVATIGIDGTDIRIGVLNSDVTNDISFAKILPANWETYLPGLNYDYTIPVIRLNQFEEALISSLYGLSITFNNIYPENYSAYYKNWITYDSGNPCFVVINNEPILLGVAKFPGAGSGSFISSYITEINNAMTSLGGGYQLTIVDLSSFSTY